MIEKDVERELCKRVRLLDNKALCLKFVSPGFSGVPDRIILLPIGRAIFVELKRPGKRERPLQVYVQGKLRALGFKVFSAVDSVERVDDVIQYCREVLSD